MNKNLQIKKSSGQFENFDEEKLRRSLRRSGADDSLVNQVMQELSGYIEEGMSTKAIFKRAFKMLKRLHRPTAGRYNLKQAMFDFGNSGYPFEDFFAELLKFKGYSARTRQLLPGLCVQHEVDVVAEDQDRIIWVECKYHPLAGSVSNIKIPLYIHSRFRDLQQYREKFSDGDSRTTEGWIATNSRFSDDALSYGRCAGLQMVGWNYPLGGSLREMVDQSGLFPLTCLSTLSKSEKSRLLERGIVLCKSLTEMGEWADILFLPDERRKHVMAEARGLCV